MGCGASSVPPPLEDAPPAKAEPSAVADEAPTIAEAHSTPPAAAPEPTGAAAAPAAAPAPAEDPRADWDDSDDDDAPAAEIPPAPLPTGWSGVRNAQGKLCIDSTYGELRLICTRCSFLVLRFAGYAWCDDVDYFHVRNYTPDPRMPARFEEDAKKLATRLIPDEEAAALACSCSWQTIRAEAKPLGRTCLAAPHGGTGQGETLAWDLM